MHAPVNIPRAIITKTRYKKCSTTDITKGPMSFWHCKSKLSLAAHLNFEQELYGFRGQDKWPSLSRQLQHHQKSLDSSFIISSMERFLYLHVNHYSCSNIHYKVTLINDLNKQRLIPSYLLCWSTSKILPGQVFVLAWWDGTLILELTMS